MDIRDIATSYEAKSDEDLRHAVVASYELSQAIVTGHPDMAQDAGFELFDSAWAKRFWRNILAEVGAIRVTDKVSSWAIGASISQVAGLIVTYYALPAVALPAAVALAIILIRAAERSGEDTMRK